MASNLPPGVTDGMLPGNRPEDVAWDELNDWLIDTGLTPEEIRQRVNDADRLAEAEELLRIASSVCDPVASKLAQRINAFLSGGGASND